jgi:hypothetical protein
MNHRVLRVLLSGAILLLMASTYAMADNVYATIHGSVTDQTGAVVQGAQITATNTSTGVSYSSKTLDNGLFEFLQLPIGNYTVTVSKQGFKGHKSTGIILVVNQVYDLPVKLDVGAANETVEVKATAVQVETTDIQQKTLIGANQIVDLPLVGRNFTQLEQLAPGVMAASDRFGTFSVNGSQSQQSNYLINGTDSNDIALNTPVFLPSPDAIQEFNLISSTINPEYGRNSGGIVNALIKSGTNQFHGNIFDFYRDTFLDTHNFFQLTKPIFHQNQFGGTFGGPIWKDKSFFFLSYQGVRNRAPQASAVQTVFSPAQRSGVFTDIDPTVTSATALVGEDNLTHPAGTAYGVLFPTGHIPAADLNPLAVKLMNQFVPLPNTTANGFTFNPVQTADANQGIAKIDHNFSTTDSIWGSAIFNHNLTSEALPFTGASLPGFGEVDTTSVKEFTVAYNHTFSNTMLNEVRLGYARLNFQAVEPATPATPQSFGFTGINPQTNVGTGMPTIAITGMFSLGFSDNGPQPRKDSNYQFTDNFSWVRGKHTMKYGVDVRRFQVDNPFFFLLNGHFDYGGNGQFSTSDPGADFLLGLPDDYIQNTGGVINARAYEYYLFAQDQWKVKPNLTLTYGTGYDIETPYHNTQFGGLDFNCFQPGAQSTVFPTAPAGLLFPGDAGCNNAGSSTKYDHFAPRMGFAWSPNFGRLSGGPGKFSVRGGFGIYFNRFEEETALQNLGAPPFGLGSNGTTDFGGLQPGFANPFTDIAAAGIGGIGTSPNKFPFAGAKPGDKTFDFTLVEPFDINTIDPKLTTPYSMNFNLNIERELPANTVVSIGYVGALGRHLFRQYEANPITPAGQAACAASAACIAERTFQHAFFPTHSLVDGGLYRSVFQQHTDGTSNYSALQVNVTKGMSHGLQLITSYTWSHSIDNGSSFENTGGSGSAGRSINIFNPALSVGDSAQDARQRLVLGYVYVIPNLHHMMKPLPDVIFGGWKLSGITTFQTGFPVNLGDTGFRSLFCDAFSFSGGCPDGPNQVAAATTLDPRTSTFNGKKDYFFNPADFTRQVIGTFGNTRRDSLHGPGINNTDFALIKDTKIRERMNFQTGIEAYNLFNHTQFGNPNTNAASSNFGRITSAAAGRVVQLRAKFNF